MAKPYVISNVEGYSLGAHEISMGSLWRNLASIPDDGT